MNERGQTNGFSLMALVAVSIVGGVAQAAEPIAIHPVIWDIVRALVGLVVLIIGFYARAIYKSMEAEKKARQDFEIRLARLETLCPFHGALNRGPVDAREMRKAANDIVRGSDT